MELVTEESQEQQETNPVFMTSTSHIQIDSISIDLSSTDIDEMHKGCDHFTIRGFVAEVRKKNGGLCFLFYSDHSDNSSDMPAYELPPMEVQKFKSSDCSNCADNSNSSPGTSKGSLGKSTSPQNKENQKSRRYKGFEKLYIKAGWTDLIDGSWTSERSAKENQIMDGRSSPEISEEATRDPLGSRGNNQSTLPNKSAKGKSPQDNAMVGSLNSRCAPSGKSVSEAVIVPFSSIDCPNDTSSRKPDKDTRMHDGSCSQSVSKGVMVPPGGSSGKATTSKSFKEPKQRKAAPSQGMPEEFSMPPPGGFYSRKNSSKTLSNGYPRQDTPIPRPHIRMKNSGEASNSTSLNKKRSYAKRSVRQAESAGDKQDGQKGRSDGFEGSSNRDSLPQDAGAMEADVVAPKRAALQSRSNEEVVSCNQQLEKNSSLSTTWRTQDTAGQNLPECDQSSKDNAKNKREPKFRSLSDLHDGKRINNLKASTSDPHDVEKKKKPSPAVSVSGMRKKRKSCIQDGEQHSPGGEGQSRTAEPSPSGSAKKQSIQAEADKSKKTRFHQRLECENICEKMDQFLQIAFGSGKAEKGHGDRRRENVSPQSEEGQTVSMFMQRGVGEVQTVSGCGAPDCIVNGNGPDKRKGLIENSKFPTAGLPTEVEHQNPISAEKESWKLQIEARDTTEKHKAGEGPSCAERGNSEETKGRVKDIDINAIPVEDKTADQCSTDDIPMDIVELLAKNQHERRCEASRDTLNLVGSTGDSNTQKHSGMLKPQASYGFSKQLEAMNRGKQKVSDNYEGGRTNVLVGYPNNGHFSGNFTGYTQSKGHVPSGAQYSSSVGTCLGIPYNNSSPVMSRQPPQPSFGRYQGNSQIWHPTMQSHGPLGVHSRRPDMYHKGSVPFNLNRVSAANQRSIPPQTWNSRFSEYANQSPTPPQNWERNPMNSEYSNGVCGPNPADFITPRGIRPVDLSTNETIPALQLLNFVQVASRSSTPPVNRNTELHKRLPFDPSGNQRRQYVPGPHFEPYKATASSSRRPSHDTTASAFQHEPKSRWHFASQGQQNMVGASSYNTPVGNLCFDKSTTRVYSNDKKRPFSSVADKAIAQGPSSSTINVVQPMKKQALGFASYRNEERALVPYNHKAEVCLTNRNPAEILDLGEAKKFMIGPEDLIRGNEKGKAPKRRKTTPKADSRLLMAGPVIKS